MLCEVFSENNICVHIFYKIGYVFLVNHSWLPSEAKKNLRDDSTTFEEQLSITLHFILTARKKAVSGVSDKLFPVLLQTLSFSFFVFSRSSVPKSINGGQSCVIRNERINYKVST